MKATSRSPEPRGRRNYIRNTGRALSERVIGVGTVDKESRVNMSTSNLTIILTIQAAAFAKSLLAMLLLLAVTHLQSMATNLLFLAARLV